ncbi:MAG: hypothetical protein KGQ32_06475, partial [Xanthomonadaceae bacterium]|nr:hypothetical protein [Xanthomonadaceae bacterium]
MRKTMLSISIAASCLLALPVFAQVSLGGAGQLHGAIGANTGQLMQDTMHNTMQTTDRLQRMGDQTTRHAKRQVSHAADQSASASARVAAGQQAGVSATTPAGDAQASGSVHADAGLDTAAVAGKAGEVGRGVGGTVRD